ncbi:uncharacterized protein LOC118441348 [Vespa mandarinia]|uniref:uncharacterized protein LOC118441348 n=1 Tax=Vespa mandarinia TaxID=7446 RepID=UPI00161067E6|nr:uncharacterized protein LOC118441348 [Vespa mandarinia]
MTSDKSCEARKERRLEKHPHNDTLTSCYILCVDARMLSKEKVHYEATNISPTIFIVDYRQKQATRYFPSTCKTGSSTSKEKKDASHTSRRCRATKKFERNKEQKRKKNKEHAIRIEEKPEDTEGVRNA